MTIQQLADAHVGHPEELGEDSIITAQRESFKWGAIKVLNEIEDILSHPLRFINADKSVEEGMIDEINNIISELKEGLEL